MKTKPIRIKHIRKVVNDIVKGKTVHGYAKKYDQSSWCGTSCCVMGHAWFEAGNKLDNYSIAPISWAVANIEDNMLRLMKKYPDLMFLMESFDSKIEDIKKALPKK